MSVTLMEYGATLLSVCVPGSAQRQVQLNLQLPDHQLYADNPGYLGATCGRFANRIGRGRFELEGRRYQLSTNDGANHLHGGARGFNRKLWAAQIIEDANWAGVRFDYTSADGEEGYPGELSCSVEYSLNDQSELMIHYQAQVRGDPTIVSLTNHSYWNLAGSGTILDHELEIPGSAIVVVNGELIPTGELKPVAGTAFDFRTPMQIGKRITDVPLDPQDPSVCGYDHCYLLDAGNGGQDSSPALAARLRDPSSGRTLEIFTDQPGVQLYTGVYLDSSESAGRHPSGAGLCLECQQLPDAPNQPTFPSTVLHEGDTYRQTTLHRFIF